MHFALPTPASTSGSNHPANMEIPNATAIPAAECEEDALEVAAVVEKPAVSEDEVAAKAGEEVIDEDKGEDKGEGEDEQEEVKKKRSKKEEEEDKEAVCADREYVDNTDANMYQYLDLAKYKESASGYNETALCERAAINKFGLLFRASGPNSGMNSFSELDSNTDYSILNTKTAVIPHRFARKNIQKGKQAGHVSMLDMKPGRLMQSVTNHTYGYPDGRSELSSWTHSLLTALRLASFHFRRYGKAMIHIIDTSQITNDTFHVPDIHICGFRSCQPAHVLLHHEWLIHGIVSGPGHWTVEFRKIFDARVLDLRIHPTPVRDDALSFEEHRQVLNLIKSGQIDPNASHVTTCKRVAEVMIQNHPGLHTQAAKTIELELAARLYCLKPRFNRTELRSSLLEQNHRVLIAAFGDLLRYAPSFEARLDIVGSNAYHHKGFPDVTQAKELLLMLTRCQSASVG